ncbi:hypothetical protein B0J12DRAFT_694049 [Macrophomina phaseolina]|uniref:BTB domain-containing protein n=1 Tax=Macrophomina phaseolina TaxID=35725 RepID=A0ABQ8GRK1_9PEZI|nr:hypothetical protein B0J12DRAFT_694049 [Macrophomina phaseolina]
MAPSPSRPSITNQIAPRYADNHTYSDLTLRFSETSLPAHRIVLASQSAWFAEQLEGDESPLKGVPHAVLDLGDADDPDLLSVLITYLYTHAYPSLISATDPSEPKAHTCLRHLRLYVMATDYRVPCVQAAAAARVKQYMEDLYGTAADLLTDFIPYIYGGGLGPKPLVEDEHGLRMFIAERAARDRLERVEACELDRFVREYPVFAVDYLTAFWGMSRAKVEKNRLRRFSSDYSMEVTVDDSEVVGLTKATLLGAESSVKTEERKPELPFKSCPQCVADLQEKRLA